MRKITFTIIAIMAIISLSAQQPLCPVKEGVVLTYAVKNDKGKVQSFSRQTVTSVEGSNNNMTITYSAEALDAKKKAQSKVPVISYSYKVENGAVVFDPKSLLNGVSKGSPAEGTSIEGTPLVIPANMKAGDVLPDCSMRMQIAIIKISADYTGGVCEGEEDITTEAGTFHCKKTKYNVKSSAIGIKQDIVVHTWYAPGVGIVKSETYNNKGKLNSVQELVELNT